MGLVTAGSAFLLFAIITAFVPIGIEARLKIPKTSEELQAALDSAQPGDTIELLAIDYVGDFVISKSSIERSPIELVGQFMPELKNDDNTTTAANSTNLIAYEETALTILADYWKIKNLNITGREEGVVIQKGHHNRLESLAVHDSKTAILMDDANDNLLGSISISDSVDGILVRGSSNYFRDIAWSNVSSGIHIESGEKNRLHNLAVHESAAIDVGLLLGQSTCCGVLTNTIFAGLAEIHGNNYNLRQTIVYGGVNVLGCNNSFTRSIFSNVYFTKHCVNKQVSQNIYHLTSDSPIKDP